MPVLLPSYCHSTFSDEPLKVASRCSAVRAAVPHKAGAAWGLHAAQTGLSPSGPRPTKPRNFAHIARTLAVADSDTPGDPLAAFHQRGENAFHAVPQQLFQKGGSSCLS